MNLTGRIVGADLSHWQPRVDWDAYCASQHFVILKASEGASYTDPNFATRWAEARRRGIPRGAYHYLHVGDGAAQARRLLAMMGPHQPGDMPPLLDYETDDGNGLEIVTVAQLFLAECQWQGRRAVVYTYPDFWRRYPIPGYQPLWWAGYSGTYANAPTRPLLWQYAGTSVTVPGVGPRCDHNIWLGDLPSLHRFAGLDAPVPNPTPIPTPQEEWLDMATQQEVQAAVESGFLAAITKPLDAHGNSLYSMLHTLASQAATPPAASGGGQA